MIYLLLGFAAGYIFRSRRDQIKAWIDQAIEKMRGSD